MNWARAEAGGLGYGDVKKDLLERLLAHFGEMRERRDALAQNPDFVVLTDQYPNRRTARQALRFGRPALVGKHFMAGGSKGGDMRHLATRDERVRCLLRQAKDLFQPFGDHVLNDRSSR